MILHKVLCRGYATGHRKCMQAPSMPGPRARTRAHTHTHTHAVPHVPPHIASHRAQSHRAHTTWHAARQHIIIMHIPSITPYCACTHAAREPWINIAVQAALLGARSTTNVLCENGCCRYVSQLYTTLLENYSRDVQRTLKDTHLHSLACLCTVKSEAHHRQFCHRCSVAEHSQQARKSQNSHMQPRSKPLLPKRLGANARHRNRNCCSQSTTSILLDANPDNA